MNCYPMHLSNNKISQSKYQDKIKHIPEWYYTRLLYCVKPLINGINSQINPCKQAPLNRNFAYSEFRKLSVITYVTTPTIHRHNRLQGSNPVIVRNEHNKIKVQCRFLKKWYRNLTSNRSFHPRQALIQFMYFTVNLFHKHIKGKELQCLRE